MEQTCITTYRKQLQLQETRLPVAEIQLSKDDWLLSLSVLVNNYKVNRNTLLFYGY
jgi:hypothetical protein